MQEKKEKDYQERLQKAASFAELIVLATLWDGTPNAIKMADPKDFDGKVVVDITNPLDFSKGMPEAGCRSFRFWR